MRIDLPSLAGAPFAAVMRLEERIDVDPRLGKLVKVRASQVNGCAYCIDMHWAAARERGESELRLAQLGAWHESPFFDERERAALAFAEEMANLPGGHGVSDAVYDHAADVFSQDELLGLLWTSTAINAWNRLCVATQAKPAGREPRLRSAQQA